VLRLLKRNLPKESITEESFTRKVLLDPNFDPNGALTAFDVYGEAVGFLLALRRRRPLEDGAVDTDRGWITLFAVPESARRQGVGTLLFDHAEAWLRQQGCATVLISPYAPNYWTPGVDEAAYPEAAPFLHKRGYTTVSRPLSMEVALTAQWDVPEWAAQRLAALLYQGITIAPFHPQHVVALTEFLRREFPGDWQRYLRETMLEIVAGRRPADELLLAFGGETLVGFAQSEGERFGPFGVAAGMRGHGLGAALLCDALTGIRARGHGRAWFLWTDDRTADRIYRPFGFRETRRYSVVKKTLSEAGNEL
jgi:mycothiol synthase